jgi:hypothetical protein
VHAQDDVLQITRLLSAEWCQPGQRIAARNAPTYFGNVSVSVEFSDQGEELQIEADWHNAPREIHWFLPAKGRKVVFPSQGASLENGIVAIGPSVRRVKLEVELAEAHSKTEGEVPGLDELLPPGGAQPR